MCLYISIPFCVIFEGCDFLKRENEFQPQVIKRLKEEFPGCVVYKNDPNYIQGFPDLTILYRKHWAVLECKKSENEPHRPNQDYWVDWANKRSFGRFVYPENLEDVISELHRSFKTHRPTRISKP